MEWLTVLAIVLGPIFAVQAQKAVERRKASHERKADLFKALMASRGTPVSPDHVRALNLIDLEFRADKKGDKAVLDAWRVYHDHLHSGPRNPSEPSYDAELRQWSEKNKDLLTDLLHAMSISLGYQFDKVLLKRGAYIPEAHAATEYEHQVLRQSVLSLLTGQKSLRVALTEPEEKHA